MCRCCLMNKEDDMHVSIYPRGSLKRYFGYEKERALEVPEDLTVEALFKVIGFEWESCTSFGFAAVNGKRVCINAPLKAGDVVKIYPRISGG